AFPPKNPYRSIRTVRAPERAAETAAARPADPPPTTTTSASATIAASRSFNPICLAIDLLVGRKSTDESRPIHPGMGQKPPKNGPDGPPDRAQVARPRADRNTEVAAQEQPGHQACFHDKGKPAARRGRKATGPSAGVSRVAEGDDGTQGP